MTTDRLAARIEGLRQRDSQSEPDDYWTGWNDAIDAAKKVAAGVTIAAQPAEPYHGDDCECGCHDAENAAQPAPDALRVAAQAYYKYEHGESHDCANDGEWWRDRCPVAALRAALDSHG